MRSTEILGIPLRLLIGGRWAISWLAYLIGLPLNLISIGSNAGDVSAPLAWFVIGLVSYAALGLVLLTADRTLFRSRRVTPVPMWWTFVLGAVAGAVRGAVAGGLAEGWGLAPASVPLFATRVLTGAVLGALLVPIGALVLSVIATYRSERRRLIDEAIAMRVQQLQLDGESEAMRSSIIASVRSDLKNADEVRSRSHELWAVPTDAAKYPGLHWTSVVWASIAHNPFPTVPVAVVWVLSAWGSLSAAIGWPRAIAQIALSVVAIALGFWLGRAWSRRVPAQSLLAFVVIMIIVVVVTGPVASAIFDPRPFGSGIGLIVTNSLWLPLLTVLVSIAITAVRSGEDVLIALRDNVSAATVGAAAARVERERVQQEVAAQLHGSVQSRLLAVAARNAQPELLLGDEASALEDALTSLDAVTAPTSLRAAVESVCAPWNGLLEIAVSVDGDASPVAAEQVRRVVEEGLTNAFRHGRASSVVVTVVVAEDITVRVKDDGTGPEEGGTPGLGSAVMDAATGGNWRLAPRESGGSVLWATLSP